MEVAAPYVKWQEPEVEEEEIAELLLERRPKHRIAASFDSEGGESGVSEVSENEDLQMKTDVNGGEIENDLKLEEVGYVEKAEVELGNGEEHVDEVLGGKNVYFDKYSGTGFSNGNSGAQFRSTKVYVSEDGSMIQSSDVTEESVTTTRTITRTQHKTTNDAETEPFYYSSQSVQANGSHHPSLETTVNGNGDAFKSNQNDQDYHIKNENTEELGLILEGDPEPIDYDVQGVLKKQETHDLICPNCHTCITRRVILKKRKRVKFSHLPLEDIELGTKREKTEEAGGSEISPDTVQDTLDQSSAITVDNTTDGQNDVITCWSCFSLLIPSGKGFKLFRVFGGRKQPEVTSVSDSIQTPLLTSGEKGTSVEQGNTVRSTTTTHLAQGNTVSTKTTHLVNGNMVDEMSNTSKKGSEFKLFSNYGNSRDDKFKSSHQVSTSQTSQYSTSSEKTVNAQGDTLSNHVEVNTKETNSMSYTNNGLPSAETDYLATHTELAGNGQNGEAGSTVQNVSSILLHSHDEYQTGIHDKHDTEFKSFKDQNSLKSENIVSSVQGSTLLDKLVADLEKGSNGAASRSRDDVRIIIENGVKQDASRRTDDVTRDMVIPGTRTQVHGREQTAQVVETREWDILKSIVYGGLIESITSLGVVSSAAGAETTTLNILALGLANLIGGLILIFHNLKDLKNSAIEGPSNQVDRYYDTLGRRNHYKRHAVVVVLSFLLFGLIPVVTYGFTFRKSDNSDYKSLCVLGASIICITLLSIGKAHTKNPPRTTKSYFKSITYYLSIAIAASGLSYIAGKLLQELIEKTGWFDTTSSLNSISTYTTMPSQPAWGSY
ncbi:unnamed protein product [Rhodiola kirilowii]